MFKKFIMALAISISLVVGSSSAQADLKDKIPNVHAGVLYSIRDGGINHSETFDVVSFKDLVFIEAGYAGDSDASDHKAILAASLEIKQLKLGNYTKLPILDLVEFRPSIYAGLGDINIKDLNDSRLDYGVGATVLTYKF